MQLEEIACLQGNGHGFRLIDTDAKAATLHGPDSIEPIKEDGKLVTA